VALIEIATAPCLRNEGVETEQQSNAEERWPVIDGVAEAHGSNGDGTELADHDEIDDAHGHPAELGQHDGAGELEQVP